MPKALSLEGRFFERLLVLARNGHRGDKITWLCLCKCGEETTVTTTDLTSGNTKSCGCLNNEKRLTSGRKNRRHGLTGSSTWVSWHGMKLRCQTPSSSGYEQYGGRGIAVCDRWQSFANFLADMGEKPTPKHSIDRIDNSRGYEPNNCRWATAKEQQANRHTVKPITFNGETRLVGEWAKILGYTREGLAYRVKRLPLDEAMRPKCV